ITILFFFFTASGSGLTGSGPSLSNARSDIACVNKPRAPPYRTQPTRAGTSARIPSAVHCGPRPARVGIITTLSNAHGGTAILAAFMMLSTYAWATGRKATAYPTPTTIPNNTASGAFPIVAASTALPASPDSNPIKLRLRYVGIQITPTRVINSMLFVLPFGSRLGSKASLERRPGPNHQPPLSIFQKVPEIFPV